MYAITLRATCASGSDGAGRRSCTLGLRPSVTLSTLRPGSPRLALGGFSLVMLPALSRLRPASAHVAYDPSHPFGPVTPPLGCGWFSMPERAQTVGRGVASSRTE